MSDLLIKCHQSCKLSVMLLLWPGWRQGLAGVGERGCEKGLQRKRNRDDSTRMEELDLAGSINTLLVPACAKCF